MDHALVWKRRMNLQGSRVRGQGSLEGFEHKARLSVVTNGKENQIADGLRDIRREGVGEGRGGEGRGGEERKGKEGEGTGEGGEGGVGEGRVGEGR